MMTEQPGITTVAMAQGKNSHVQTLKLTIQIKFSFAPVKLTGLSRRIIAPYKSFPGLRLLLLLSIRSYVFTNTRITDVEALIQKHFVNVLSSHILLFKTHGTFTGILLKAVIY